MNFISRIRDKVVGGWAGAQVGADGLRLAADAAEEGDINREDSLPSFDRIRKGISGVLESAFGELELAFEDKGWRGMGEGYHTWNFTRSTLRNVTSLSRVMYLINPLIKRAVTVQELYVWGRGVKIEADTPIVDEVLQDFFSNVKNQSIVGQGWAEREREQRLDGNTFFIFYRNRYNGAARVRLLPFDQIEDVVSNPDDCKEPWFYKRCWTATYDGPISTSRPAVIESIYYPDFDYNPRQKPTHHVDGIRIDWDACVYHLKTGGLSMQKFGVPELFSTLNWATAYKKILENFATILAAHARLAMQIVGLPGKRGIAATKSSLSTGITSGRRLDNNPPPNTASWALMSGTAKVEPIKTAGSTTGPDEARALRSMVAAGSDTPEHFFGDSDIGNFATSTTLDRPTELKMISRQEMWSGVIRRFCNKLIEWSASASNGKLNKAGYNATYSRDLFDGTQTVIITPPTGMTMSVNIEFPNILERDVTDRVRSIVQAVTLGGSSAEGIIPDRKVVCSLLLEALGERDSKRLTEIMYPEPVIQGFIDPADKHADDHLAALGKKELGDAALQQADAAKINASKPAPKPVAVAATASK